MNAQQEGYVPSNEKKVEKEVMSRLRTSKKDLKQLKYNERFPQLVDGFLPLKSRRISLQRQTNYYEETNLEVNEQKAKKYWQSLDPIFFGHVSVDDLTSIQKKITIPNDLLFLLQNEFAQNNKMQSYLQSFIHQQIPEILQHKLTIKALFEGELGQNLLAFFQPMNPIRSNKQELNQSSIHLKMLKAVKVEKSLLQDISFDRNDNELQKQIKYLERSLSKTNFTNQTMWEILKSRILVPQKKLIYSQIEIDLIKEKLNWATIVKLFSDGHRDKTISIFQYYNISGEDHEICQSLKSKQKQKKKFQTDCKICFCGANCESNVVVYCDLCNTSFHMICYGLKNIPKSEKYFCQVCTEFKLSEKENRPSCKICEKKSFPMKKMQKHYYHVTCLVLNNLVQFRNFEMCLRKNVNYSSITQMVVDSQIRHNSCQYCNSPTGMRFGCPHPGCTKSFHPICAYLNGCVFEIKRGKNADNLNVKVLCGSHHPSRNSLQQVYYRRYVCDFKKTSQYSFEQFKPLYQRQLQQNQAKSIQNKSYKIHNILFPTQLIKSVRQRKKNRSAKVQTQISKYSKKPRQGRVN